MKKKFLTMLVLIMMLFTGSVFASEVDILLQKLVEKGVLTAGEAQEIFTETQEETRKKRVESGEPMSLLPTWMQNTKVSGDLRLRYQNETDELLTGDENRQRGRIRYRLGIDSKVNNNITVGAGLATGGADPRSTNQTLEHAFSTKSIMLDYAYVQYMPNPVLTVYGGKFKRSNVIWEPSDFLWDGDINPEGVALTINKTIDSTNMFFNTGFYTLESFRDNDVVTNAGQSMTVFQPGIKQTFSEGKAYVQGAVTYYDFEKVKENHFHADAASAGTNTYDVAGNYEYNYSTLTPSVEIGFIEPFGGSLPSLVLFAEYIKNQLPEEQNEGYIYGIKFGHAKVSDKGQWQTTCSYRRMETDAWLDIFPDSDFYGGDTNAKGYEIIFEYGLNKNVNLGLDYYKTERIDGDEEPQTIFQADLVFKF